jgi:hypothetical protein
MLLAAFAAGRREVLVGGRARLKPPKAPRTGYRASSTVHRAVLRFDNEENNLLGY